uniref:27 kDa protein n=1 Tax=Donkey orchid symptomless virus TaxID=1400526 RepID=V5LUG6_9VIRU|nr:27 kDa protein [Donkey orchid symptomless virus]
MLPINREEVKESYRYYCHNKDESTLPKGLEDAIIKSGQEEQLRKYHRINYEPVFDVIEGRVPPLPPPHDSTLPDAEHQAFEARCRSFIVSNPKLFPGEFSKLSGASVFITQPFKNIEGWHHELYLHYNLYLCFKAYGHANHFIIPPVPKRSAAQFLYRYFDRNIERLILARTTRREAHYYDVQCPSGIPNPSTGNAEPSLALYCSYHDTLHVNTNNIHCRFNDDATRRFQEDPALPEG